MMAPSKLALIAAGLATASSAVSPAALAARWRHPVSLATLATAAFLSSVPAARGDVMSVLDEMDKPGGNRKVEPSYYKGDHVYAADSDKSHGNVNDDSEDDESSSSSDDDGSYEAGGNDRCLVRNANGSCRFYDNVQHFRNDLGELEIKYSSCDDPYEENQEDFEDEFKFAKERSLYQMVTFEENLAEGDKCLRLDNTLQQCSSYRPHYHEPFVHQSAAYLNKNMLSGVKRVVFVGGGDSMLLHEILKYDELEMVLGLELDQKVTRNSFEHFKTQPHFDNPKVQWWFGDGAKSLTLLPRDYFGTFDLVLLDLSETVMSMTVTKGLDVFGAMKLLLSPTGIMVKNDFGYFEKLAKVFDTCIQLLIPDVNYICDYELVLCGSDEVNFLEPSFDHLKGVKAGKVDTLVYRPQDEERDDHWGPVVDYSKYWNDPLGCKDSEDVHDPESVAYAGVLMIVEAENVAFNRGGKAKDVEKALTEPLRKLGYNILSTTSRSAPGAGVATAVAMAEGYILSESYPDSDYFKLDIHLWGGFDKQADIRSEILSSLGCKEGQWSSYRIVTGGMRGTATRPHDLDTTGPDLSQVGKCLKVEKDSPKAIVHDSKVEDEASLAPLLDAGYADLVDKMVGDAPSRNAVVFCDTEGPCAARDSLSKLGFASLAVLRECSQDEERAMKSNSDARGEAMRKWSEAMSDASNASSEISICGKRPVEALYEVAAAVHGVHVVAVDARASPELVIGTQEYWRRYSRKISKPFLMLAPLIDTKDVRRRSFLDSRHNNPVVEPEFYSEIYLGDGSRVMSFGLIHQGNSLSLQGLVRARDALDLRDEVKIADVRKVTIRGAMRTQMNYNPVKISWNDYDQVPGLEQYYGQRAVGLQTVFQLGINKNGKLSFDSLEEDFRATVKSHFGGKADVASHKVGKGGLLIALTSEGQVAVTWDGDDSVILNIFSYSEDMRHDYDLAMHMVANLPSMSLNLKDEMPRGHGKVITKSERVNFSETPSCYDHYKMCVPLSEEGNCKVRGYVAVEWMNEHCMFSCGHCGKKSDEL